MAKMGFSLFNMVISVSWRKPLISKSLPVTAKEFRAIFRRSAVRRAKLEGLQRNARGALENKK